MVLKKCTAKTNHFHGFKPYPRWYFFLKCDLNWAFFIHSNTLESHVINLRCQENLKTKRFVQEMREIAIVIYLSGHFTLFFPKLICFVQSIFPKSSRFKWIAFSLKIDAFWPPLPLVFSLSKNFLARKECSICYWLSFYSMSVGTTSVIAKICPKTVWSFLINRLIYTLIDKWKSFLGLKLRKAKPV